MSKGLAKSESLCQGAWLSACPGQLCGFRFLVRGMEVMRIKAVSLAVVKIESGDWSEEELEEEEGEPWHSRSNFLGLCFPNFKKGVEVR